MVNKSKKIIGTLMISCITLMMSLTAMATVKEYMQGVRINTVVGVYSPNFFVNTSSAATPYLEYTTVTTEGYYGVTSQSQSGSNFWNVSVKQFYATTIASGRSLTGVKFKNLSNNRVLVYRIGGTTTDFTINLLRVDI